MIITSVKHTKAKKIQEWRTTRSVDGGVDNLNVCRLNHPGDGAMAVATGTSKISMDHAVRNAYRNLKQTKITCNI